MDGASFILELGMRIMEIYTEIDGRVSDFKEKTKLSCLRDCGECCQKNVAKMTPIEFIPLAIEIFSRGETERYLKILKQRQDKTCILYRPHKYDPRKGYCSFYSLRAATCRLYGYGIKKNKHGQYEPVTCEYLRSKFRELPEMSFEILPDYDSAMIRIFSLYPSLSSPKVSPNRAILLALEKVSLLGFSYEAKESSDTTFLTNSN